MGSEHFWKLTFAKIAPRLRARAIWKSKSLKHQVLGTFLEVESAFCVAGAGISTRCKIRGRRRSSWGLQKRWQAWWILKRVWNDAFHVAGALISRFVMSMFEASDAESVEGLQISCRGSVTLQWSFRVAVTGLRMPRLNFFVAGAVLLKHPLKNR